MRLAGGLAALALPDPQACSRKLPMRKLLHAQATPKFV